MTGWPACAAICGTGIAAIVDARTGYIPDRVSIPATAAALVAAAMSATLLAACGGALAVGGTLLGLHVATRGRGLGLGDVKLGTTVGAGLGAADGLAATGAAFVLGAAYAAVLLTAKRARRSDTIPFAPFLAGGTVAAVAGLFEALR